MVKVEPVDDSDEPVGTLRWSSWTGREYVHRPPEAAVKPLSPSERVQSWSLTSEPTVPSQPEWTETGSLAEGWARSVAKAAQEDERRRQREQTNGRARQPAGKQTRQRDWRAEARGGDTLPAF